MPTVEGFTQDVFWTTLYGLFAIGLLFLIVFRVYDAIRTISERRRQRMEARTPDFAEKVSQRVIDKLEPRFNKIERNLEMDKHRLDEHEDTLDTLSKSQQSTRQGLVAICKFMLVLSTHGNLGDNEHVNEAKSELNKFLAEQMGQNQNGR